MFEQDLNVLGVFVLPEDLAGLLAPKGPDDAQPVSDLGSRGPLQDAEGYMDFATGACVPGGSGWG